MTNKSINQLSSVVSYTNWRLIKPLNTRYTSRGPGCGNYSELVFIESKGWNGRIAGYATVSATRLSVKISR